MLKYAINSISQMNFLLTLIICVTFVSTPQYFLWWKKIDTTSRGLSSFIFSTTAVPLLLSTQSSVYAFGHCIICNQNRVKRTSQFTIYVLFYTAAANIDGRKLNAKWFLIFGEASANNTCHLAATCIELYKCSK